MPHYVQCVLLRKPTIGTTEMMVTWIPSQFAKVGKKLKLAKIFAADEDCCIKGHDEVHAKYEEGWRVVETGAVQTAEYMMEFGRDFTKQREVSDI